MYIKSIELNEWIDKFNEVKPHLDELCDSLTDVVDIINDGCNDALVRRCAKYLRSHGILVNIKNKENEV